MVCGVMAVVYEEPRVKSRSYDRGAQEALFGALSQSGRFLQLSSGFAVRLAHASHAERNRVMGRAVNWSRKAHQTQGTLMRTVHLTGALLLLLALLFCRLDGAAAQVSDAARQACTPDAMRLCSDVLSDVARVTACMKAKSSQVSPACRVFMRGGTAHGHGHYHGHYHHHYHH